MLTKLWKEIYSVMIEYLIIQNHISWFQHLINSITYFDVNAIVLDSFAGSGTTAHAVINLNNTDEEQKVICVEMDRLREQLLRKE